MQPVLASTDQNDFKILDTTIRNLAALTIAQAKLESVSCQPKQISCNSSEKQRRRGVLLSSSSDGSLFDDESAMQRPTVDGDQLLQNLYGKLDHIDRLQYPRSHHQVKFHDCFTRACLRIIYGDDYDRMEKYLLQEFDVDEFRNEVMIVTPRRFGKTFSVAQFCAAFATSILNKEVAIFSTGRRASKKILDLVIRFIRPIMRPTQKIVLRNVEEVHLFDSATQSLNKVCSYPSKVQVRFCSVPFCLPPQPQVDRITNSPASGKSSVERVSYAAQVWVFDVRKSEHIRTALPTRWTPPTHLSQRVESRASNQRLGCKASGRLSGADSRPSLEQGKSFR